MAITIDFLPFTITVPGDYVLASDLTTSGHGIIINADNVTVNFNGHTIQGSAASNNQFYGVSAFNRDNITINGGSIDGFFYGIYLSDLVDTVSTAADLNGGGHLIEDMRIQNSTFRGIRIEGQDNVIRNNTIDNIGGTTVYPNALLLRHRDVWPQRPDRRQYDPRGPRLRRGRHRRRRGHFSKPVRRRDHHPRQPHCQ